MAEGAGLSGSAATGVLVSDRTAGVVGGSIGVITAGSGEVGPLSGIWLGTSFGVAGGTISGCCCSSMPYFTKNWLKMPKINWLISKK
ncbi:MAG: hypothetical protein A3I44_05845 [Candidatus Sungbacteria bacterium RIFCSPLOWO2_02_FULL_51_17]|uniref:Uncharacterized protein n=1 Tax=Candidatus Sungbacteria bacterium RIFCSPHIGHO2_02_FULL_51_29 TaxID=1802273 RepID=A0A1G2KTT3_9BACT|nr:MAG: hypothetical protein A2676_03550 [Candidatus Sungbacteria bacterium RIFCSPHIGHO2_01_FULL_51_22]OHA01831.1 MAG: hypothetical protein A3C16_05955 [Candidatus Sungbacteria bacterium RIFCSPHIGHO2_02_FULL_51_29]OHA04724.1 MAG: hypothetical protein A3B29_02555 [Candidatus Sungbacteria bacterium RIFCSPLOWO2_01_FULL_51_34]OHA12373.1 MAG: hypothetical protein A3I44_05845 [Candidatus Sungbacteria bacterium RIFCSPLOWO2_02_FULL_51_17]